MKPHLKSLSEEIVRWGFEVGISESKNWKVAFTNPTAGPWKRVMALDSQGVEGEVHRFEIDETRPDLVLYSDKFETVLIVEAKTDIRGLLDASQASKTADLFLRLKKLLTSKEENNFWGQRSQYRYELALLWGETDDQSNATSDLASLYQNNLKGSAKDLVFIRGKFVEETLKHDVFWAVTGKAIKLDLFD
jgi:hypothetical protein